MLETNLRIILPGPEIALVVRRATVHGSDLSKDLLEKACGTLRHRYGLAAIPLPGSSPYLLVATERPLPTLHLEQENWELDVKDSGELPRRMSLSDTDGPVLLPKLLERVVLACLARGTDLWTLDSPRLWYERTPFRTEHGVNAYRRYEISASYVEGVGVGIAVDVGTAFFTTRPVSFFFDTSVPAPERDRRMRDFGTLTGRQAGQKGTLMYDNGRTRIKCYLEQPPSGTTCATTGKIRLKNATYGSLAEFYRVTYPGLSVSDSSPAAKVSFLGLSRPQWVAADRLWARVMNDYLPRSLRSADKISPGDRRAMLEAFWARLGSRPLAGVSQGLAEGFWCPESSRLTRLPLARLHFGGGKNLEGTPVPELHSHRSHYGNRLDWLTKHGCYEFPQAVGRTLFCAYPKDGNEEAARQFASAVVTVLGHWTGRQFTASMAEYDTIASATQQLRREQHPGAVMFILNQEPTAYYETAFQLPGWRIKRITTETLRRYYESFAERTRTERSGNRNKGRDCAGWDRFVITSALDMLQQMDGVPWRLDQAGPYEAQIAIDVGHDRRHVALSVLVARERMRRPSFRIVSNVQVKPDVRNDAINPVLLADQLEKLLEGTLLESSDPIQSLLVLRDGQVRGREREGIERGVSRLRERGLLASTARVDVVELHKQSLRFLRLWEVEGDGTVTNSLEGTCVRLSERELLIVTTGKATLRQGTSNPLLLVAVDDGTDILDAARAVFAGAQLNWASPGVAQRLPIPLKRSDEDLKARAAQEIRRLR